MKMRSMFFSVSKIILLLLALTEQGTGLINFSSGSLVRENIPPGIESLLGLWVHSILRHLLHTPTLSSSIRMKQCNVVKVSKQVTDLNCGHSRWRRKMRWIKMCRKKCWRINQPDPLLTCKQNAYKIWGNEQNLQHDWFQPGFPATLSGTPVQLSAFRM